LAKAFISKNTLFFTKHNTPNVLLFILVLITCMPIERSFAPKSSKFILPKRYLLMKSLYFKEEHQLFRQSVREFIQREVVPHTEKWESERRIPKEVFKKMGDLGYLGINFPEEYGGMNADFWYSVVFLEELAKCGMGGFSTAVSVH